ncbi:TonB-dependent receptor [Pedobacter nutrimenti]|uniref:TonB-dependent receptor n=1 Tax=Pedobacter nutrimenti TaxID=1241337 RepID=UPI00292F4F50|nr:TonB-dependent receptor [Pedobacter nutrimenti]
MNLYVLNNAAGLQRLRKILLVMKLTTLILILALMQVSGSTLAQKVTFVKKNVILEEVFEEITRQTGYNVFYADRKIDDQRKIDVEFKNATLHDVMKTILQMENASYLIENHTIVINKIQRSNLQIKPQGVSSNQNIHIKGLVKDEKGQPLPNVSIKEKGTARGTLTNNKGEFAIEVKDNSSILLFSIIGFSNQERKIDGSFMTIVMNEDISTLEQMVVVGYGMQKKVSVTGSVATVKGKDLVKSPVADLSNALVGRLPGLRATQRTGEPGYDNSNIDIRGFGNALVIVDGIPSDNFSKIDANEIESFTILKDASAAVYGVRAANGVILITTKKGAIGKARISYSAYYGLQSNTRYPRFVNAAEFAELRNEAAVNTWIKKNNPSTALSLPFTKDQVAQYKDGTLPSTDWFNAAIRKNTPQSQHNLNIDGGNDDVKYFFSLGYLTQSGMWKSDDTKVKRYNFRSNVEAKIGKGLTAGLNLSGFLEDRAYPGVSATTLMSGISKQFPTNSIYANNNPNYFSKSNYETGQTILLMDKNFSGYDTYRKKYLSAIANLTYEIPSVDGLKAKALFSYQNTTENNKNYLKKYFLYSYDAEKQTYNADYTGNDPSRLTQSTLETSAPLFQLSLNYDKKYGKHTIAALGLFESQQNNSTNFSAYREFLIDGIDELFAGTGKNQKSDGSSAQIARLGYVGKVNYDYSGKYLFEFGFRYDGTYKFQSDKRFGFFPNLSAGWRISEEHFMKNIAAIDNLKLRVSWGKVGDDGGNDAGAANYIKPFQYLAGYKYPNPDGTYIFGTDPVLGLSSSGLTNPLLTWFKSTTTNIGLDLSLWKGLLSAEVDVFYRKRTGLLSTRILSLPNTFGANLPQENLNSDNTRGFEIVLTHKNQIGNWQYTISPNLSFTRTKNGYLERASNTNALTNWLNNNTDRWNNLYRGYVATGQFQSQDEINKAPQQDGSGNKTLLPGDIRYKDINGDGIIDENDQTIIGRGSIPEIFYGLNFRLSYKGFDFSVLLQGATNFNFNIAGDLTYPFSNNATAFSFFTDRWHREDIYDPNSKWIPGEFPSTIVEGTDNNKLNSTFWLRDATYLRLKNFEIGYTLNKTLTDKIGVKNTRVFIAGQNTFTFSKVKYLDPEISGGGAGKYYPQQRVWTMGINIGL